jgi:serine/threonine protein kinase
VAQPKVIDFGVAKAVQKELTEATFFTRQGQLIGTPEYMSPEQAEAAPVDTRTDVYSLGAVLYELLAGVLPIDATELRQAGLGAMMRLIREQDPLAPSTPVSTLDGSGTEVAHRRSVDPRFLARSLRGELDCIALKALEKDPDRRYSTVAELSADLKRHLADEPVSARPASTWYMVKKFSRRHRVGVGAARAIVGAVAVLAVSMTFQAQGRKYFCS